LVISGTLLYLVCTTHPTNAFLDLTHPNFCIDAGVVIHTAPFGSIVIVAYNALCQSRPRIIAIGNFSHKPTFGITQSMFPTCILRLIQPLGVQLPSGVAYSEKMVVFSGTKHILSNVTHDPISGKASIVILPFILPEFGIL